VDSGTKRPKTHPFLSSIKREQEEDDNDHPSLASTATFGSQDTAELDLGDLNDRFSQRLGRLRLTNKKKPVDSYGWDI